MRIALLSLTAVVASLLVFGACQRSSDVAFSSLDGREYLLKVPVDYDASSPRARPLIIAMHGYGSDSTGAEQLFQLDSLADEQGFLVVYPRGTLDPSGRRFFNATDACCNFYGSDVDDVGFIDNLIDHIQAAYLIDPSRIYAMGHSNGGFMSFRLACDSSSRIAAIVSLEGAMGEDASRCRPTSPVGVLEVHGSADVIIRPGGGSDVNGFPGPTYPSVDDTMLDWALADGCPSTISVPGASPGAIDSETPGPVDVRQWQGCSAGLEQWMIEGGTHAPQMTTLWPRVIVDFLMTQQKQRAIPVTVTTPPVSLRDAD